VCVCVCVCVFVCGCGCVLYYVRFCVVCECVCAVIAWLKANKYTNFALAVTGSAGSCTGTIA
jgi:hypothetical protein